MSASEGLGEGLVVVVIIHATTLARVAAPTGNGTHSHVYERGIYEQGTGCRHGAKKCTSADMERKKDGEGWEEEMQSAQSSGVQYEGLRDQRGRGYIRLRYDEKG